MADKNAKPKSGMKECYAWKQLCRRGQPDSAERKVNIAKDGNEMTKSESCSHSHRKHTRRETVQPLVPLRRAGAEGTEQKMGIQEMIFVGEQVNSAKLQPLVCLLEARGQGFLRSALDGD
jgi:hypothetical protein